MHVKQWCIKRYHMRLSHSTSHNEIFQYAMIPCVTLRLPGKSQVFGIRHEEVITCIKLCLGYDAADVGILVVSWCFPVPVAASNNYQPSFAAHERIKVVGFSATAPESSTRYVISDRSVVQLPSSA